MLELVFPLGGWHGPPAVSDIVAAARERSDSQCLPGQAASTTAVPLRPCRCLPRVSRLILVGFDCSMFVSPVVAWRSCWTSTYTSLGRARAARKRAGSPFSFRDRSEVSGDGDGEDDHGDDDDDAEYASAGEDNEVEEVDEDEDEEADERRPLGKIQRTSSPKPTGTQPALSPSVPFFFYKFFIFFLSCY
jgi:hypothetical protein